MNTHNSVLGKEFHSKVGRSGAKKSGRFNRSELNRFKKGKGLLPTLLVGLISFSIFGAAMQFSTVPTQAASATAFVLTINGEDDNVEIENNQTFTLQIEALDESLQTMEDYDGTITITSSDNNATLPADYTFKLSDVGIKSFDLGLKLTSPGEQTITVQDIDAPEVMGVTTVTVSGSGGGSIDPDAPVILIPNDNSVVNENVLDIVGTATPNADVSIYDGSALLGSTESDSDGEFVFSTDTLFTGTHVFKVTTLSSDSTELESNVVRVTVDDAGPMSIVTTITPSQVYTSEIFTVTVEAEKGLLLVQTVIDNRAEDLVETPIDSGTYTADVIAPSLEGTYPIDIEVTDQSGNTQMYQDQAEISILEQVIEIPNVPPVATPSFVPSQGKSPLTVQFTSNASDSDGQIVAYYWDFGNGSTSTESNPSYTFTYDPKEGDPASVTYTVQLTVTDDKGATYNAPAISVDANGNQTSTITILSDVGPGFYLIVFLSLLIAGFYHKFAGKRV